MNAIIRCQSFPRSRQIFRASDPDEPDYLIRTSTRPWTDAVPRYSLVNSPKAVTFLWIMIGSNKLGKDFLRGSCVSACSPESHIRKSTRAAVPAGFHPFRGQKSQNSTRYTHASRIWRKLQKTKGRAQFYSVHKEGVLNQMFASTFKIRKGVHSSFPRQLDPSIQVAVFPASL
jgi:hypothetical protein